MADISLFPSCFILKTSLFPSSSFPSSWCSPPPPPSLELFFYFLFYHIRHSDGGPFFSSPDSVVAHGLYLISFYSCTKESKVGRKRAANLNTSAGKPSSNNGFDAFERDGQGHQVRSCWVVPNRIKTRLLFYFDFICFSIFFFIFILTCSFPFLSLADGWTLLLGLPRT